MNKAGEDPWNRAAGMKAALLPEGSRGWVFPDPAQRSPEVDDARAIEVELSKGRPPNRSEPQQVRAVFVPGEMVPPGMSSRIVERHPLAADGIEGVRIRPFVTVAALAAGTHERTTRPPGDRHPGPEARWARPRTGCPMGAGQ